MNKNIFIKENLYIPVMAIVICLTGLFYVVNYPRRQMLIFAFLIFLTMLLATVLIKKGKNAESVAVLAILIISLLIKSDYVIYTPSYVRQHDVIGFGAGFGQAAFIEYFYEKIRFIDFDPRDYWGFFQPPLHHIIAGLWLRFMDLICPNYGWACDNVQLLTLFYSALIPFISVKIFKKVGLHNTSLALSTIFVAIHPCFILLSGSINNDILCILFQILAMYFFVLWNVEIEKKFNAIRVNKEASSGAVSELETLDKREVNISTTSHDKREANISATSLDKREANISATSLDKRKVDISATSLDKREIDISATSLDESAVFINPRSSDKGVDNIDYTLSDKSIANIDTASTDKSMVYIILTALCMGLTMMAKLSGFLIAPAIGLVMMMRLIELCKLNATKLCKPRIMRLCKPTKKELCKSISEDKYITQENGRQYAELCKLRITQICKPTKIELCKSISEDKYITQENGRQYAELCKLKIAQICKPAKIELCKSKNEENHTIICKNKRRHIELCKLIVQYAIFGIISVPLGIWSPVRNLIKFGVPLNFTPEVGEPLTGHSVLARIFDIRTCTPFTNLIGSGSEYDEFNFFLGMLKTSLVGEYTFSDISFTTVFGWLLLISGAVLTILIVICAIIVLKKRIIKPWLNMFLLVYTITTLIFYVNLCFSIPNFSSLDFRYIAHLIVIGSLYMGIYVNYCNINSLIFLKQNIHKAKSDDVNRYDEEEKYKDGYEDKYKYEDKCVDGCEGKCEDKYEDGCEGKYEGKYEDGCEDKYEDKYEDGCEGKSNKVFNILLSIVLIIFSIASITLYLLVGSISWR